MSMVFYQIISIIFLIIVMCYGIPIRGDFKKGVYINMKKESEATERWQKENIRRVTIKLHKINDVDIIDKLDAQVSMQGYIKRLIKDDVEKNGK